MFLEPVGRNTLNQLLRIVRPRSLLREIQKTRLAIFLRQPIAKLTRLVIACVGIRIALSTDYVIFLATLAAERQRE
jgi:hypothetical protein